MAIKTPSCYCKKESMINFSFTDFCFPPVGCGVGGRAYARTAEALPQDLSPPVVTATASASIEVKWFPPKKPNGIITNYFVYRYIWCFTRIQCSFCKTWPWTWCSAQLSECWKTSSYQWMLDNMGKTCFSVAGLPSEGFVKRRPVWKLCLNILTAWALLVPKEHSNCD